LEGIYVKKVAVAFLVALFLLICLSSSSEAIKIWPGIMTIDMPEGYQKEPIHYRIQVTNTHSYGINVSARVENPHTVDLSEGYSYMADLSWIRTEPETLFIPAESSKFIEVYIEIPETEKPLQYNKSWESHIIISSDPPRSSKGVLFRIELVVKLFIHTPPDTMGTQAPLGLYLLIGIIGGFVILITFSSIIKKKRAENLDRAAIFYVKKKERTNKNEKN